MDPPPPPAPPDPPDAGNSNLTSGCAGRNQLLVIADRMEAKLKEYRALRRRKELIENISEKYEKSKTKLVNLLVPKIIQDMGRVRDEEASLIENEEPPPAQPTKHPIQPIEEYYVDDLDPATEANTVEHFDEKELASCRFCLLRWALVIGVWAAIWVLFLYLQFGAVYFVISLLIGIYLNTRTGPRRPGEVSAYSVFNRNCVSIEGTLKPEQFEREIRYGVGTVKHF